MIKAQFTQSKVQGYGLALGIEFAKVKVRHPYHKYDVNQPTFTLALRILKREYYIIIYKPATIRLNRAERRANHLH